jgi:hypothetical protein
LELQEQICEFSDLLKTSLLANNALRKHNTDVIDKFRRMFTIPDSEIAPFLASSLAATLITEALSSD